MALAPTTLTDLLDRGIALHRQGRPVAAIEHYQAAILGGGGPPAFNLLAAALLELGQSAAAETALRRAIAGDPGFAPALGHRGNALKALRRIPEAIGAYRRSLAVSGDDPLWLRNLGLAQNAAGDHDAAVRTFRRILRRLPDEAETLNSLGSVEIVAGDAAAAMTSFRRAVAARPELADSLVNLALARLEVEATDQAMRYGLRALAIDPNSPDALNAVAASCLAMGGGNAPRLLRRALARRPDFCEAHYNLGLAAMNLARLSFAGTAALRALAIRPSYAEAEWNLALARLLAGRFHSGWRSYEARWRMRRFPTPLRPVAAPMWQGEDLRGRRILLRAEQGLGDTIQFIRYAPLLAARGAEVIVECQPPVRRLIACMPSIAEVRDEGEALPPFDFHAPLMSLPRLFQTELDTIPCQVPYIPVPKITPSQAAPAIGLVWAGSAAHRRDRSRSLPAEIARALAARLARTAGTRIISLQLGPRRDELSDLLPHGLAPTADFLDTAQVLLGLRLLISVDTAIVHAAGALALPTLVLLPFLPDFRWLLAGSDSPWYPTLQLIRQPSPDDWETVLPLVEGAIADRRGLLV